MQASNERRKMLILLLLLQTCEEKRERVLCGATEVAAEII